MTCFQLFLPHFALRRPSSLLLAVIYATASSRGVKGGCVWLPKELGMGRGGESSALPGWGKDLPKVTQGRDGKSPQEAAEPQPRGGDSSAAPCAGQGRARRG